MLQLFFGRNKVFWSNFDNPVVYFSFIHSIISTHIYGFTMMVNLSVLLLPESVHVGVQENHKEGKEKIENKPNINHFNVAGGWKADGGADEQAQTLVFSWWIVVH